MAQISRKQLEAEVIELRRSLAGLDNVLRTIQTLGNYTAETLTGLIERFADDRDAQIRVADAVAQVATTWAEVAEQMGEALAATKH
ncbi:hypothetical protein [Methylobacterium sp. SI9]|uniref:hypothetical protein n=1 Tax=Methylobacterium guangdongense TaxID=3138811 RepID=UPI00313F2E77